MVLIILILLVTFVVIPLVEMTLKERILYTVKLLVYLATFLYVAWQLFATHILPNVTK